MKKELFQYFFALNQVNGLATSIRQLSINQVNDDN